MEVFSTPRRSLHRSYSEEVLNCSTSTADVTAKINAATKTIFGYTKNVSADSGSTWGSVSDGDFTENSRIVCTSLLLSESDAESVKWNADDDYLAEPSSHNASVQILDYSISEIAQVRSSFVESPKVSAGRVRSDDFLFDLSVRSNPDHEGVPHGFEYFETPKAPFQDRFNERCDAFRQSSASRRRSLSVGSSLYAAPVEGLCGKPPDSPNVEKISSFRSIFIEKKQGSRSSVAAVPSFLNDALTDCSGSSKEFVRGDPLEDSVIDEGERTAGTSRTTLSERFLTAMGEIALNAERSSYSESHQLKTVNDESRADRKATSTTRVLTETTDDHSDSKAKNTFLSDDLSFVSPSQMSKRAISQSVQTSDAALCDNCRTNDAVKRDANPEEKLTLVHQAEPEVEAMECDDVPGEDACPSDENELHTIRMCPKCHTPVLGLSVHYQKCHGEWPLCERQTYFARERMRILNSEVSESVLTNRLTRVGLGDERAVTTVIDIFSEFGFSFNRDKKSVGPSEERASGCGPRSAMSPGDPFVGVWKRWLRKNIGARADRVEELLCVCRALGYVFHGRTPSWGTLIQRREKIQLFLEEIIASYGVGAELCGRMAALKAVCTLKNFVDVTARSSRIFEVGTFEESHLRTLRLFMDSLILKFNASEDLVVQIARNDKKAQAGELNESKCESQKEAETNDWQRYGLFSDKWKDFVRSREHFRLDTPWKCSELALLDAYIPDIRRNMMDELDLRMTRRNICDFIRKMWTTFQLETIIASYSGNLEDEASVKWHVRNVAQSLGRTYSRTCDVLFKGALENVKLRKLRERQNRRYHH